MDWNNFLSACGLRSEVFIEDPGCSIVWMDTLSIYLLTIFAESIEPSFYFYFFQYSSIIMWFISRINVIIISVIIYYSSLPIGHSSTWRIARTGVGGVRNTKVNYLANGDNSVITVHKHCSIIFRWEPPEMHNLLLRV